MDDQNSPDERAEQQTQFEHWLFQQVSSLTVMVTFVLLAWLIFVMFNGVYQPDGRSVVARVRGDQRTFTIALETYYLDYHNYPAWSAGPAHNAFGDLARRDSTLATLPTFTMAHGSTLQTLTTPVSYITSYFNDPFAPAKGATFCYWHNGSETTRATGYIVWSPGPDNKYDLSADNIAEAYDPKASGPSALLVSLTYDPSNGTSSGGDVYRFKQ